jgi:hypothetical protein
MFGEANTFNRANCNDPIRVFPRSNRHVCISSTTLSSKVTVTYLYEIFVISAIHRHTTQVLNLTSCRPITVSNMPAPHFILLKVFDSNAGRHHQCVIPHFLFHFRHADLIFVVSIRSIHTVDNHTAVSTCFAAQTQGLC